ncbi:MAG: hypothetical protein ACRC30_05525, partial [Clostridium sp.]
MKKERLNTIVKSTVVAVGISAVSAYGTGVVAEAKGNTENLSQDGILRVDESVAVISKNILGSTNVNAETMEKW